MIDTFPVEVCRVWIIICGAEQLNGALRIEGKKGEISPQWYSTRIPDSNQRLHSSWHSFGGLLEECLHPW